MWVDGTVTKLALGETGESSISNGKERGWEGDVGYFLGLEVFSLKIITAEFKQSIHGGVIKCLTK